RARASGTGAVPGAGDHAPLVDARRGAPVAADRRRRRAGRRAPIWPGRPAAPGRLAGDVADPAVACGADALGPGRGRGGAPRRVAWSRAIPGPPWVGLGAGPARSV